MAWRAFDVEIEAGRGEIPQPPARVGFGHDDTAAHVRSVSTTLVAGQDATVEIRPEGSGDRILVGLDDGRAYLVYHREGDVLFQLSSERAGSTRVPFVVGGQETQMEARLLLGIDDAIAALDEVLRASGLPARSRYGDWEQL